MNIDFNNSTEATTTTTETNKVHIRVFKRTGRKYTTIVEGLDQTLDFKAILKKLRKEVLFCNGKVETNKETDEKTIKLQGDHQEKLIIFFGSELAINKDNIIVHGSTG